MLQKIRLYFSRKKILRINSEHNDLIEVVRAGDKLILDGLNVNYSFGSLHRLFRQVFNLVNVRKKRPEKVLLLGFGAGSCAYILNREMGLQCRITGVEIDPEVISIAKKYFGAADDLLISIVEADACRFVREHREKYDMIVVDVYNDFSVPLCCQTKEFLENIKVMLRKGGMLIFNKMLYNHDMKEQAGMLKLLFDEVFENNRIIRIRNTIVNWVFVYEDQRSNI